MKKFRVGDKFEVVGIFSGRPAFHEITKIENGVITTDERWTSEDTWEDCEAISTFKIEIDKDADAERIEVWEYSGEHGYVWATNEDKKEDKDMTIFKLNGTLYKTNLKGNYYYKSTGSVDKKGNPVMMRIAKHVFEQAFEEFIETENMDDALVLPQGFEIKTTFDGDTFNYALYRGNTFIQNFQNDEDAIKEAIRLTEDDKDVEQKFNGKKEKKARKPRRSKDVAYTYYKGTGEDKKVVLTLTAKQVDFIQHLPDNSFYENGLESVLWCDCLADDIGGQFAGKPMTIGAMISTLREKNVISVDRDESRQGKPKYMTFTEIGQEIAHDLGLN